MRGHFLGRPNYICSATSMRSFPSKVRQIRTLDMSLIYGPFLIFLETLVEAAL